MAIWIILGIAALLATAVVVFINQPSFGRLPRGERLARIERSPNYRNGIFHNQEHTTLFTSDKSRLGTMLGFLFRREEGLRPDTPIPAVKTDLHQLAPTQNSLVWFGHSSYLIQTDGKRILVDPVFCSAAPLAFLNKPFAGTDLYKPEDMPAIDYLVITHDHWDHLDYRTVKRLKDRIGRVICPLGVGEHFERWGFAPEQLTELDWDEDAPLGDGFTVHCLPARHFSGRSFTSNKALWASFLFDTPSMKIYLGGDSGYGKHFARIGAHFPGIDLAVLENGQYNTNWRNIHTLPDKLPQAAKDLKACKIITVHHSKFALARHRWDEPLETEQRMIREDSLDVLVPVIGKVVEIGPQ